MSNESAVVPDSPVPPRKKRGCYTGKKASGKQKTVITRNRRKFNTTLYVTEEFFNMWDRYVELANKVGIGAGRLILIGATSVIDELEEELPKLKTVRLKSGLVVNI